MSKPVAGAPGVPPAEDALVSRLQALFAALVKGSGDQTMLISRGRAQLLHTLFRGSGEAPLAVARHELSAEILDLLLGCGLLRAEHEQVRALFQLQTFQGLIFLADLPRYDHLADYVLPIGTAGRSMARLTIRRPVGEALDLGCGTGIQAALIARHARHVTATDINPRALMLTRLNARLNGIENIETRQGSLLAPVAGRTFDLILFNTPYILSPLTGRPHSHAGARADAYLYELLSGLPDHLNEGGFAQIMTNWTHRASEIWWTPLQAALTGRGLDALVVCQASLSARNYTDYWLKYEIDRARRPIRYALTAMLWRRWYRRRRIERVGFGSLTLRRRSAADTWLRFETASAGFGDSLSDQFLAIFHNQDRFARGLTPDMLLASKPRLVNIEVPPAAQGQERRLAFIAGQGFPLQVRRITIEVIVQLDGRTSIAQAIREAARRESLQVNEIYPAVLEDMLKLARYGWIALES